MDQENALLLEVLKYFVEEGVLREEVVAGGDEEEDEEDEEGGGIVEVLDQGAEADVGDDASSIVEVMDESADLTSEQLQASSGDPQSHI